jgi:hypothetical protein
VKAPENPVPIIPLSIPQIFNSNEDFGRLISRFTLLLVQVVETLVFIESKEL